MTDVLSAALKKENLVFRRQTGGSGPVSDGIAVSYDNMKFGDDVLATLSSSSVQVSDSKKLEWNNNLYLKDNEIGSAGTKVVSVSSEQIAFETGKSLNFNDGSSVAQLSLTKDSLSFTGGAALTSTELKHDLETLAVLSGTALTMQQQKTLGWDSQLYLKDSELGFNSNAYLTLSDADGGKVTVADGKKLEWDGKMYLKDDELGYNGNKLANTTLNTLTFDSGKSVVFVDDSKASAVYLDQEYLTFDGGVAFGKDELYHGEELLSLLDDNAIVMQQHKSIKWDTGVYIKDRTIGSGDADVLLVSDTSVSVLNNKAVHFVDSSASALLSITKDSLSFTGGTTLTSTELKYGTSTLAVLYSNEVTMQADKTFLWDKELYLKNSEMGFNSSAYLTLSDADGAKVTVSDGKKLEWANKLYLKNSEFGHAGTKLVDMAGGAGKSDLSVTDAKSLGWTDKLYLKDSELGHAGSPYVTLGSSVMSVSDGKSLTFKSGASDALSLTATELKYDSVSLAAFDSDKITMGSSKTIRMPRLPTDGSDLANKTYVDSLVTDSLTAFPSSQVTGLDQANRILYVNSERTAITSDSGFTYGSSGLTAGNVVATGTVESSGLITAKNGLLFKDGSVDKLGFSSTELKYAGVSLAAFDSDKITMGSSKTIRMARSPTDGFDLANKTYVDSVASGLDVKEAVKWLSPYGAADALTGLSGSVAAGDRVLVSNRTDAKENGIYVASASAWSRSADLDTGAAITGVYVYSVENSTGYVALSNATDDYVGTHAMTWTVFNSRANLQYATGLQFDGNVLSVTPTVFSSATAYPSTQVTGLDQAKRILYVNNDRTAVTSDAGFTYDPSTGLTTFGVTCTSDARLKTDIAEVQCSDVIHKLRPVQYKWKDADADQRTKYGFLAQEVQELLPSVVNKTDDRYGVEYMNFIALLVAEVQKLRKDVDAKLA